MKSRSIRRFALGLMLMSMAMTGCKSKGENGSIIFSVIPETSPLESGSDENMVYTIDDILKDSYLSEENTVKLADPAGYVPPESEDPEEILLSHLEGYYYEHPRYKETEKVSDNSRIIFSCNGKETEMVFAFGICCFADDAELNGVLDDATT